MKYQNSLHRLHPNKRTKTPLTDPTPQTPDTPQNTDIQPTKPTNPTPTPHNPNWKQHANCRGKNHLMFPQKHKDIEYLTQARQICNNCTVQTPCLEEALQYPTIDMHGVWAGLTSRQLAAEQRRRGITPTKPTIAATWNHHK